MRTLKALPFPPATSGFHFKQILTVRSSFDPDFFIGEEVEAKALSSRFFGRQLQRQEYAALCGCISDASETIVGIDRNRLYLEFHDRETDCVGQCLVDKGSDSRLILCNEHVRFLNPQNLEDRKLRWFSMQKKTCEKLGFFAIQLFAAKSSISQGYRCYPLMGFQAKLPQSFRSHLRSEYSAVQTLHEIITIPEVWKLWLSQGVPLKTVFEIGPYSPSQLIFDQFFREKTGIS